MSGQKTVGYGCTVVHGMNSRSMRSKWQYHFSPQEVYKKRLAIFKHQSQKDLPVFPGDDAREFWVRAEDRTSETAQLYNNLGLAEYEAIEAL